LPSRDELERNRGLTNRGVNAVDDRGVEQGNKEDGDNDDQSGFLDEDVADADEGEDDWTKLRTCVNESDTISRAD
jgi:hypothetical protein